MWPTELLVHIPRATTASMYLRCVTLNTVLCSENISENYDDAKIDVLRYQMMSFKFDGPIDAGRYLILAHGAGAPMSSPFMNYFSEGVASAGIRVVRFEFPYMVRSREDGKRRPPDRAALLIDAWHNTIKEIMQTGVTYDNLFIGGKSLGGRIASMIADDAGISGLVCLGYPFHPPGRHDRTRVDHLAHLTTPALFVQGERDALGSFSDVAEYELAQGINVRWLEDGDHSFKPRKASGRTERQNWNEGVEAIVEFVSSA